jgi:hypothetical protein
MAADARPQRALSQIILGLRSGCRGPGRTIVRSSDAGPQMAATILSSTACEICARACRLQMRVIIGYDSTPQEQQTCKRQTPTAM